MIMVWSIRSRSPLLFQIAATEPSKLSVRVGTTTHVIDIPVTGSGMTWKSIPLGTIELPAEETVLERKPVPTQWKPIHPRKLTLQP